MTNLRPSTRFTLYFMVTPDGDRSRWGRERENRGVISHSVGPMGRG